MTSPKLITPLRAVAVLISSMFVAGAYISLGFHAPDTDFFLSELLICLAGGIVTLCYGLTYTELAARIYKPVQRKFLRLIVFIQPFISGLGAVNYCIEKSACKCRYGIINAETFKDVDYIFILKL